MKARFHKAIYQKNHIYRTIEAFTDFLVRMDQDEENYWIVEFDSNESLVNMEFYNYLLELMQIKEK